MSGERGGASDCPRALVFDLGGTHLRCGVAMAGGKVADVEKHRIPSLARDAPSATVWRTVLEVVGSFSDRVAADRGDLPLVLAFPGPVAERREILSAPTLVRDTPSLPDLAEELEQRTERPVYLLNDVSAACWYLSRHVEVDRFLVVTVSSGIGSKLFDRDHRLGVVDDQPFCGEIGHLRVDPSPGARLCGCGGRGHLGMIASGRGVELEAREAASADPEGFGASACRRVFGGTADALTNEEHIVPAARAGDAWILEVLERCTRPLAEVLLQAMVSLGVRRVVLIGGFAVALGDRYRDLLEGQLASICDYHVLRDGIGELVALGSLEAEACLHGAAAYAEDQLEAR